MQERRLCPLKYLKVLGRCSKPESAHPRRQIWVGDEFLSCMCVSFLGKIFWRRDRLPTPVFLSFPCDSDGKESAGNVGLGSVPEFGRSPGGGHGNLLQYSCLVNPHGQRSLEGYSPWDHKEWVTTDLLSTAPHPCSFVDTGSCS